MFHLFIHPPRTSSSPLTQCHSPTTHPPIYPSTMPSTKSYFPATLFIYLRIYLSVDLMSLTHNIIHPSIYTSSPSTQYLSPTTPFIFLYILLSILHCHSPLISSIYTSTHCCSSTSPSIYLHIYHSVDLMSLAYNTIHLSTHLPLHPPNVILPLHHPSIYTFTSPLT